VLGLDIRKYRKRIQDQIGYLSQRFSLYGDLSIDENIEFFARIHGVTSYKERRDELLDMMRLTPFRKRLAERLSGGMKQKLALACSLIHTPKIIFLDEPTTGVDPVSRRDFWKILSDLQGQQITIFMTTPYLDEAERCNRVAVMHQGKILMLDSAKQIKRNAAIKSFEVVTSQVRSAAELLKAELDFDIQLFGDRLNVLLPVNRINETDNILNILSSANLPAASTRITEPSLENVFIYSLAHLERSET
jgi:ABC-2 type transport system ATP-binding protein